MRLDVMWIALGRPGFIRNARNARDTRIPVYPYTRIPVYPG